MSSSLIIHKTDTGRYYKGIPIHAAGELHEHIAKIVLKNFEGKGKCKVLELGAGSGALTERLFDLGYTVLPVDIDDSTWLCSYSKPVILDLNSPEWPRNIDEQFPVVLAVEVIEHLENPKQFIRGLFESTAPGGLCIITTPNVVSSKSVLIMMLKQTFYGFNKKQYFDTGHISILPWWLIQLFAEEIGFEAVKFLFSGKPEEKRWKLPLIKIFGWLRKALQKQGLLSVDDGDNCVAIFRRPIDE